METQLVRVGKTITAVAAVAMAARQHAEYQYEERKEREAIAQNGEKRLRCPSCHAAHASLQAEVGRAWAALARRRRWRLGE